MESREFLKPELIYNMCIFLFSFDTCNGGLKNFCNIIISMDYAKKFFPDFQFILECRSLIILTTLPMYIVHIIEFFF